MNRRYHSRATVCGRETVPELERIDAVLRGHALVGDTLTVIRPAPSGRDEIVSFFTLNHQPLRRSGGLPSGGPDNGTGGRSVVPTESPSAAAPDPTGNAARWKSSYTERPLPLPEIQEQIVQTAKRVLGSTPRRVLEIGVGSGLLMPHLAPHVEVYAGVDSSRAALDHVGKCLSRLGAGAEKVHLFQATPMEVAELHLGTFDTIILNSVLQFYPSLEYATAVLCNLMRLLTARARIFIGDVHSAELRSILRLSTLLARTDDVPVTGLRGWLHEEKSDNSPLSISPAFFASLPQFMPEISAVLVEHRRGQHDNEFTRFHYDVWIEIGNPAPRPVETVWMDWTKDLGGRIETLRRILADGTPLQLGLRGIPNERLRREAQAIARLPMVPPLESIHGLDSHREAAFVHPEALWALEIEFPYTVHSCWSGGDSVATFDALLVRKEMWAARPRLVSFPLPIQGRSSRTLENSVTAQPGRDWLIPELRRVVERELPDHLHPRNYVAVGDISEVDSLDHQWIDSDRDTSDNADLLETPHLEAGNGESRLEWTITRIWTMALGIQSFGRHDHFFAVLGGNSVIAAQVMERIRSDLTLEIPLQRIFEYPTLFEFAGMVKGLLSGRAAKPTNHRRDP